MVVVVMMLVVISSSSLPGFIFPFSPGSAGFMFSSSVAALAAAGTIALRSGSFRTAPLTGTGTLEFSSEAVLPLFSGEVEKVG